MEKKSSQQEQTPISTELQKTKLVDEREPVFYQQTHTHTQLASNYYITVYTKTILAARRPNSARG